MNTEFESFGRIEGNRVEKWEKMSKSCKSYFMAKKLIKN